MSEPSHAPVGAATGSRTNVLGPGIIGLFIQGIGDGMVLSLLATWLCLPGRTEHRLVTALTVFIATIGLVQTTVYFFSTWQIYVEHFGEPVIPNWTLRVQIILTVLVSAPVQSLLLWRCYYILKKNVYIIIPLFLLLLGSVVLAIFDTIGLMAGVYGAGYPSGSHAFWSLLLYNALSSTLDIALSSIVFYYLTRSRRRVFADHAVQWISRLIVIAWQSAIPPTICAIGIFMIYMISHRLYPGQMDMWFPMLQAAIGKLYVLSHFYNITACPFVNQPKQPPAHTFTLTVPALHGMNTSALNTPEGRQSEFYTDPFERTDDETESYYYGSDSKTTSMPLGSVKPTNGRVNVAV